ncbi:MAG: hypothetical protein U1F29_05220 [Planctomycetota bacterium]
MQHRPVLSTGFALFLMTAGSIRAEAQLCAPDWIGFPVSGPRGPVFALQEHDDGSGNALFLGGSNLTNGGAVPTYVGVMRWRGAALEPLYPGTTNAMTSFDFGAGPELFAAGAYPTVPIVPQTIDQVLRWNGATFTPLGSSSPSTTSFQPNSVYALAAHDDGGGSALYAGGNFQVLGGASCQRIGRWNGSAWTQVGAGLNAAVNSLCVFDDGGGARLYAGGSFTASGSSAVARVARWDGASWLPVGAGLPSPVQSLAVFDAGTGARLYAGLQGTTNSVWRLDGGVWSIVGATNGGVLDLRVDTIQSVTRLYASGTFTTIGGTPAERVAAYDGATWSALAAGLRSSSSSADAYALHGFDRGNGRELFAGGGFRSAGTQTAYSLAGWNGSAWSGVAPSLAPGGSVSALADVPFGAGRMLAVGGTFHTVGTKEARHIALWNGTNWTTLGGGLGLAPLAITAFDDGAGTTLFAGGGYDGAGGPTNSFAERWDGTAWVSISAGLNSFVRTLAVHDDGTGSALYAAGNASPGGGGQHVMRWNGTSWTPVGAVLDGVIRGLASYDDGTGAKLYAVGEFSHSIAAWDGSSWSPVGGGLTDGTGGFPPLAFAVRVHDDGGGPRLFVCGQFTRAGGVFTNGVAAWNGTTWSATAPGAPAEVYTMGAYSTSSGPALVVSGYVGLNAQHTWRLLNGTWSPFLAGQPSALAAYDSGSSGGEALYMNIDAPDFFGGALAAYRGCALDGAPYCAGDGADASVTIACPCGNSGDAGRGCANSVQPLGALLSVYGASAADDVRLLGTGMPLTAPCVFLKGDDDVAGGVVFGDGVRCVGGNLIRLGTLLSSAGSATYPGPTNPSVSTRGQTPPGSGLLARYQVYFRNAAAAFCPPSLFNVSNGWRLVW